MMRGARHLILGPGPENNEAEAQAGGLSQPPSRHILKEHASGNQVALA